MPKPALLVLLLLGAILTVPTVFAPALFSAYMYGVERQEQSRVRSDLRTASGLNVLEINGNFETGVKVQVKLASGTVITLGDLRGAVLNNRAAWIEQVDDLQVWSVGCNARLRAARWAPWLDANGGALISPGSDLADLSSLPNPTVGEVLAQPAEIVAATHSLPQCAQWHRDLSVSLCTVSTPLGPFPTDLPGNEACE